MKKTKTIEVLLPGVKTKILTTLCLLSLMNFMLLSPAAHAQNKELDHLVISEIQAASIEAQDEFIELYNPTKSDIDISSWSIQYKSASGAKFYKKNFEDGSAVPAKGFYLIAHKAYLGEVEPDLLHSSFSLTLAGGTIFLVRSHDLLTEVNSELVVDKVGWGESSDGEGVSAFAPGKGESIVRLPSSGLGHNQDSEDNNSDFILNVTPHPQNSISPPEPTMITEGSINDAAIEELAQEESGLPETETAPIETAPEIVEEVGEIVTDENLEKQLPTEIIEELEIPNEHIIVEETGQEILPTENSQESEDQIEPTTERVMNSEHLKDSAEVVEPALPPEILPGEIVINEFVSDPQDGEDEWIELFNTTHRDILISGLTVEEGSGRETIIEGTVNAQGFLVIVKPKGNLNNKGDQIILKSSSQIIDQLSYGNWDDGNINDNAPMASDPFSVARKIDGRNTGFNIDDLGVTTTPTKGQANIITAPVKEEPNIKTVITPIPAPIKTELRVEEIINKEKVAAEKKIEETEIKSNCDQVIISEIMPNPQGSDDSEWIELFNRGDQVAQLSGCWLDDAEGGSKAYQLKEEIQPGQFLVLSREQTKLALNNNGDAARLINGNGLVLDNVKYKKSKEGVSLSRTNDDQLIFSSVATPAAANQTLLTSIIEVTEKIVEEDKVEFKQTKPKKKKKVKKKKVKTASSSKIIKTKLKDVRKLKIGKKVKTKGVVSALPGTFGKTTMYVAGSGVQLYMYKQEWPELNIGDVVEIAGVISQSQGERRIKLSSGKDIKFIEHGDPPQAHKISLAEVGEKNEGYLVSIQGEIIERKSNSLFIDDGKGEVKVVLKGFAVPDAVEGDMISVTGVISQTSSGYRLLPRGREDLEIVSPPVVEEQSEQLQSVSRLTKKNVYTILLSLAGVIICALLILMYYPKMKAS